MKPWLLQFGCVFLALLGGPVAYFLLLRNPWVRNTAWPNLLLLAIALAWGFIQLRQGRTAWTIIALALTLLISIGFVYIRFGLSTLPPTQVKAQVGLKAPDFTLPDTQGGQFSLSSLRGRYKVILLFFRGVWWAACNAELQGLGAQASQIEKLGARVVAVSADSPQSLASFKKKLGLDFILLSDDKREVISLYGLVHPSGRAGQDIARPATLLIDKEGVICWMQIPSNYMVRPDPEEVLRELGKL